MWDMISSLSTLSAVLVALFLPNWQKRYKIKVSLKEIDDMYTYLIENNSINNIKITEINYRMIQLDGIYNYSEWKSYNFHKNDKLSDDFGITWSEGIKEGEEKRHYLSTGEGIIKERGKSSLTSMNKINSTKKHHPDINSRGILWVEVIIHNGKKFKSRKIISRIKSNTEYDKESSNFNPPKDDNYYEYDRFGKVIHEPPDIVKYNKN